MYFWGTIAMVFVLVCVAGWNHDRKRNGGVGRHLGQPRDVSVDEAKVYRRWDGPPSGGGGL